MSNSRPRTTVTYRSPRFNAREVGAHFINPCCFGEDCAAWLAAELRAAGVGDVAEPWQEDWGWQTSVGAGGARFLVSVGLLEACTERGERDEARWHVSVDAHRTLADRLLGRRHESALAALVAAVHRVLVGAPDVGDVCWEAGRPGDDRPDAADPFA